MKRARCNTNGTQRVKGSGTFYFIHRKEGPNGKKIIYAQFSCDIRLQIDEISRTRLLVGGDRLDYDEKKRIETAGLKTIKIHLNSSYSTEGVKYAAVNIGNFYTNSKLDSPEYMHIHSSLVPKDLINKDVAIKYMHKDGYV